MHNIFKVKTLPYCYHIQYAACHGRT